MAKLWTIVPACGTISVELILYSVCGLASNGFSCFIWNWLYLVQYNGFLINRYKESIVTSPFFKSRLKTSSAALCPVRLSSRCLKCLGSRFKKKT